MVKTVLIAGLARVQLGLMPRCNSVPVSNYAIHILNAPFTLWSHSTFNECHSRVQRSQITTLSNNKAHRGIGDALTI